MSLTRKHTGFFLIDKPSDWTSFDVCARVRKHLDMKKVGHTGTLDPFATGLLVVAVGRATKTIPYLEKAEKEYLATVTLGATTPTHDTESELTPVVFDRAEPTQDAIEQLLASKYMGQIMQRPPMHSAIKIKGQRAYKLARRGDTVMIPERPAVVHQMEVVSYTYPHVQLRLRVAAGFYVRALARDLGQDLGTGAYCSALRRTAVGPLRIEDAEPLPQITLPVDPQYVLTHLPQIVIDTARVADFWAGRAFPIEAEEGSTALVTARGKSVGIGIITHGKLQPKVSLA